MNERELLLQDIQTAEETGYWNQADAHGQTPLDRALDLAGYEGDRSFYSTITSDDPVVSLILSHGGETSEAIYERELEAQLAWADHHYGCHCKMPFQRHFCN